MAENVEPPTDSKRFLKLWNRLNTISSAMLFWIVIFFSYVIFGSQFLTVEINETNLWIFFGIVPIIFMIVALAIAFYRDRLIQSIANKKGLSTLDIREAQFFILFLGLSILSATYYILGQREIMNIAVGFLLLSYIPFTLFLSPLTKSGRILVYLEYAQSCDDLYEKCKSVNRVIKQIVDYLKYFGLEISYNTLRCMLNVRLVQNENIDHFLRDLENWFRNNDYQPNLSEILIDILNGNEQVIKPVKDFSTLGWIKKASPDHKVELMIVILTLIFPIVFDILSPIISSLIS